MRPLHKEIMGLLRLHDNSECLASSLKTNIATVDCYIVLLKVFLESCGLGAIG